MLIRLAQKYFDRERSWVIRPWGRNIRKRYAWCASVVLFPLLLNSAELLNIFKADPVLRFSFLQTAVTPGPLAIHPSFDPSIGVVFQPLGRRAADELLHDRIPWWNSDQGIGAPLIGQMSPGALFPFILLEALPNGQTILDVVVQIMAGVFTLLLALRLKLGFLPASLAAILFEANGTFAWLNAGWCYPLPFLPLVLYGIELTVGPVLRERVLGTVLIAVAVAISISAAMIEVAYLDGLLCVVWALLRIGQTRKVLRIARLIVGGLLGVLVAAPILIAFADYLRVSYVGGHAGNPGSFGSGSIVLAQVVLPYVLGPTFYHDSGYAGVAISLFAICGLFGRYLRPLRLMLAAWVFVTIGASSGVVVFNQALLAIPGVRFTAYARYLDGSWEFALALLAAFFVYDLRKSDGARLWIPCTAATVGVLIAIGSGFLGGQALAHEALAQPGSIAWSWISGIWAVIAMVLIWVVTDPVLTVRRRMLVVAGTLVFEASANYLIPTLGYPTNVTVRDGSVAFLQSHLGLQRFFSFGPLFPSYGSYFGIAELDDIELPVAVNWANYMSSHLDRSAVPGSLLGQHFSELAENLDAYEEAATSYVVIRRSDLPSFQAAFQKTTAVLSLVYLDDNFEIYGLPHPSPYFSAPGCVLMLHNRERVAARCPQSSRLLRRELYLPGWSATVNGTSTTVSEADGVYESVPLPAGSSTIVFSFLPPFMLWGYIAFGVALLPLAYEVCEFRRLKRVDGLS